MEWTPLIIGLTVAYFIVASITTFEIRVTQAKREGTYPPGEPVIAFVDRNICLDAVDYLRHDFNTKLEVCSCVVRYKVCVKSITGVRDSW